MAEPGVRAVLVLAPHGLDEVLGCGGAMARHADEGDTVHVLVLCGDGTGRDAQRRVHASEAARILGTREPRFAGFPENRSDTVALLDVVGAIEKTVAEVKPRIVYVSHGGNLNIDHQTCFRAAVTALRPVPQSTVRSIYAYEILSSTDRALGAGFQPTCFVDITARLGRKIEALKCYGDEMRPAPHSRSIEGVHALARVRGGTIGVAAAEAFALVRERVTD